MKKDRRKGGDEMIEKENAVIACEVKIGVTAKSWNEIQEMLRKIHEACDFNHKLKINFDGEFFKTDTSEFFEGLTAAMLKGFSDHKEFWTERGRKIPD